MARITLIRHGKAEMPRIGGDDFERGLIQRGMQNAEAVGQFIQDYKLLPDLVLVSPARRARQTYELMSASWPNPPRVVYEDKLYEVSADTLLRLIFEHGRDVESVAVVGHNPSLVVLLTHFSGLSMVRLIWVIFQPVVLPILGLTPPKLVILTRKRGDFFRWLERVI